MGRSGQPEDEEIELLTKQEHHTQFADARASIDSSASSDASLSFALLGQRTKAGHGRPSISSPSAAKWKRDARAKGRLKEGQYRDEERDVDVGDGDDDDDESETEYNPPGGRPPSRRVKFVFWLLALLCLGGWVIAFVVFAFSPRDGEVKTSGSGDEDIDGFGQSNPPGMNQLGEKITMEQWMSGSWRPMEHEISWIPGANGEDGLLLKKHEGSTTEYLRVEHIMGRQGDEEAAKEPIILMKRSTFTVDGEMVFPDEVWPSPNLKTVLVVSDKEGNWRHSYTGKYWLFDVESQKGQALDPQEPEGRVQLASWSPTSDSVVFTRNNNMFIRDMASDAVKGITTDGGVDLFLGIPDWVYEEEVFEGNSATWWSSDGKYVSFLRTDETDVPEFPVQYFISRPSGDAPPEGEEQYPDVVNIKYPKAGAPNPIVNIRFYDIAQDETFSVDIPDDFSDDDRLITEVVWAGDGKVLVRETNRESDILAVVLIDTHSRTGKIVRLEDIAEVDGGWVEVSQTTHFIPADPDNGRPDDGYIDTVIEDGYEHLAYFTPLDSDSPVLLTSGDWEVVESPTAVDLQRGLVYFVATKEAPWERHIYSVKLDGSQFEPVTDTSKPGYYEMSFSKGAGYAQLNYQGPGIPWQRIISTPANEISYDELVEDNPQLKTMAKKHAMPSLNFVNVSFDEYTLPVLERRPPNFDPKKKYPVLFHLYGGPGSQSVDKKFTVDFQTYVASSLEYIVVTVDGRGTGFIGRDARCIVRDNLGHYEARDQIEAAKIWGQKSYVDESRMAIWGWSYGGFMALKTLEQDGGRTFQYGMAVAPVTDWQFYDSIYTERYMHTPQNNPDGYANAAISNTTALTEATRFLILHGTSDDNVHIQNSLTLLDKLDQDGVDNYDVHIFPDSNHGIYFHNAYEMVHSRLSDWLVNAFNGEWAKIQDPVPKPSRFRRALRTVTNLWARE